MKRRTVFALSVLALLLTALIGGVVLAGKWLSGVYWPDSKVPLENGSYFQVNGDGRWTLSGSNGFSLAPRDCAMGPDTGVVECCYSSGNLFGVVGDRRGYSIPLYGFELNLVTLQEQRVRTRDELIGLMSVAGLGPSKLVKTEPFLRAWESRKTKDRTVP